MRSLPVIGLATLIAAPAFCQPPAPVPEPIRFARHPSLSPDGARLAFAYHGDLWTVGANGGTAQRLTVHEANEQFPVWSPDGKWIAFSSNRRGSYDVWVIPASGGEPTRLTYHSGADYVTDWSPDGSQVLFTSARETTRTSAVYAVAVSGGRSRLIRADDVALANARFTPDGGHVICTRGGSWTRSLYRGSGCADLLIVPSTGGPGRLLTHSGVNERWAMPEPNGTSVCYVSDRSGAPNIVRRRLVGGAESPLTGFKNGTIFYPSMARDGSRIAFERDFGIWTLDIASRRSHEVVIYAPSDYRTNPDRAERFTSGVQEFALSPDGRQLAFVVHGEVFVQPTAGAPEARRLTDTPQREEDISWSPDGRSLALVSDRTGAAELYILDAATRTMRQITRTPRDPASSPMFSPDGKSVAFVRGASGAELCVVSSEGGGVRTLVRDPSVSSPQWSPDSKWIAYSRMKSHSAGSLSDVFIVNVADPKPVNVTRYPVVNSRPVWSPDGSRLFFSSNRTQVSHIWSVALRGGTGGDDEEDATGERGAFELGRVHLRARRITSGESPIGSFALAPDGKTLVFSVAQLDRTDLWRVPVTGGTPTRLTQSGESAGSLQFSRDGSVLYYTVGGSVRRLDLNRPSPAVTPVSFSAAMTIHTGAEMLQMFDEAWRKMRDGFYDEKMHGCDWNGVYERYRPVAERLATRDEFYALFALALGELNASHCGISGPREGGGPETGCLGVKLDDAYAGPGVRVAWVMPRGPASRARSRLGAGDVLLKLDGQEVASNERLFGLLEGKAGRDVELSLRAPDGKPRQVKLRPITGTSYKQLDYDRWVAEREALVDRLSSGRFRYVHLSAMSADNLEKFKRAALGDMDGRDGLVLDMRFNGGGSIADEIFSVIENRVFGWRTIRGDPNLSPSPLPSFGKPLIVLANESSLSNAEVFPWGMKALKLGKVVGMRTYGGVIGTGGTTLIDGSSLRMPGVGAFTLDGSNMENNGCPPDIAVEHTPEDIVAGRDRQLERAVAELLREVGRPRRARSDRTGR